MLLTEMLVLAGVAGLLSAIVAYELPPYLLPLLDLDADAPLRPDWRVWAFLTVISLVAAVGSGLTPALESLKVNTAEALKSRPGMSGGRAKLDARSLLVISQITVAVALLAGSAVFVRAYLRTVQDDPGFDARHTMLVRLGVWGTLKSPWPVLQQSIAGQARALPGVEDVAFAQNKPPKGAEKIRLTSSTGLSRRVRANGVSPSFFSTMGVPLLRGRALQADDPNAGGVVPVVVSERLATDLLPGKDPLGETLQSTPDGARFVVVGMARDIAQPGRAIDPILYRPLQPAQDVLLLRFTGDALSLAHALSSAIERAAPGVFGQPETFQATFDHDADEIARSTLLVSLLGGCTLLLSFLGVYGTISFVAGRRLKELGIRAALGARGRDIVRALTSGPVKYVGTGLAMGVALTWFLVPVAGVLEKDVQQRDPLAYAGAVLLVAAAALAAMVKPAYRAMSADPMTALRDQ